MRGKENEEHEYFNEKEVLEMLGGLEQKYYVENDRKARYRLKNGDIVVIRSNSQSSVHYWYNVHRNLFHSDVQYVVCVAGYEGVYRIPISIIANFAEEGHISCEKDGKNYKPKLKRYSGKMCLHFTGTEEPLVIEQFQIYHPYYEKTDEIKPAQAESLSEGSKKEIIVNAYERNKRARRLCIEHYGTKCQVCGFDFSETYSPDFNDLIEVHRLSTSMDIETL